MERAIKGNKENLYLVFIDLDNFKLINDKYGHFYGDELLRKLSAILMENFGMEKNVVSRWGGDEFAIIFYGEEISLKEKLKNVKKKFNEILSDNDKLVGLTTSYLSFENYDDVSKILIDADVILYKEKGKKKRSS